MAKTPAWQRKEGQSPSGGLNAKGRASAKAEGHNLKPPQPEGGSRKNSFCARMTGMKEKLTSKETANDPDSRINKSLRAWNCADGGAIWDKPRPKKLGKPEHLSSSEKKSVKAMAKAAGRPYPNLVDNMRAARAHGGAVEQAMEFVRRHRAEGGELEGDIEFMPEEEQVKDSPLPSFAQNSDQAIQDGLRLAREHQAEELRRIAAQPSYVDYFSDPLKYGVQTMVSPDIAPQRVTKALVEAPETAKQFAQGLAQSAYSGATLPGDVVRGKVNPLSEEGIRRAADLAGLAQTGSLGFTRPAGSLASGASRPTGEFTAAERAMAGVGHNQPPVATPIERPSYERVYNPMGYYSHGAEAAYNYLPETASGQDILRLLTDPNKGRVTKEEMYHSGVADMLGAGGKFNRADIVKAFERSLPQTEQVEFGGRPSEADLRLKATKQAFFDAHKKLETDRIEADLLGEPIGYHTYGLDSGDYGRAFGTREEAENYLSQFPESTRERISVRGISPASTLQIYNRMSGNAAGDVFRTFPEAQAAISNYPESIRSQLQIRAKDPQPLMGYGPFIEKINRGDYGIVHYLPEELRSAAQEYADAHQVIENSKIVGGSAGRPKGRYFSYTLPGDLKSTSEAANYGETITKFPYAKASELTPTPEIRAKYQPQMVKLNEERQAANREVQNIRNQDPRQDRNRLPSVQDMEKYTFSLSEAQKRASAANNAYNKLLTDMNNETRGNLPDYAFEHYSHNHWDDGRHKVISPAAHLRHWEMELPEGKKSFHIEESQSDMGQNARKLAKQGKLVSSKQMKEYEQANKDYDAALAEFQEAGSNKNVFGDKNHREWSDERAAETIKEAESSKGEPLTPAEVQSLLDYDSHGLTKFERQAHEMARDFLRNDPQWRAAKDKVLAAQKRRDALAETIPGSKLERPYIGMEGKATTESWTKMNAKTAIQKALEGGHDAITWTMGDDQALRYTNDLRQSLNNIEWKTPEAGFGETKNATRVVFNTSSGDTISEWVDKQGNIVGTRNEQLEGKTLADLIGKDTAKKILAEPNGNIDARDIVMGAGPMKAYYDPGGMLDQQFKEAFKELGIKNVKSRISHGKVTGENFPFSMQVASDGENYWLTGVNPRTQKEGRLSQNFKSWADADNYRENMYKGYHHPVAEIPITQEMREAWKKHKGWKAYKKGGIVDSSIDRAMNFVRRQKAYN